MWTTQFTIYAIAPQHAESPCLRPGRDVLTPVHQDAGGKYSDQTRKRSEQLAVGRVHSNRPIKKLTSLEHRMHNHRQSARNGDCGTFEPQSFPQLHPPRAQAAISTASREDNSCGFEQETAQMGVAAARDMTIIVDLA
jgi:hypothetical protein